MTTKPLNLAQFEGHTYKPQSRFVALLTECKRQREQIKTLREALRKCLTPEAEQRKWIEARALLRSLGEE